jgi:hypothetical protein
MYTYTISRDKLKAILTYRQAVEAVCEGFPQFNVVASFALIIKSIYSAQKKNVATMILLS